MRPSPLRLYNTPDIELWPAALLHARSNRDARALARSRWVLRRKSDGRFLAAALPEGLLPLVTRLRHEPGIEEALDCLDHLQAPARGQPREPVGLPVYDLQHRLDQLGIDREVYDQQSGLALTAEPDWLVFAGRDRYRRPLWLQRPAARAWQSMQSAAYIDNVLLEAISGYRSHAYQLGIFERKFARGLDLPAILAVNAAPGYSEHHSGRALDIGTPGDAPAEESFETTAAFDWLSTHAARFGFRLSYPRDNPHGIVYEPWHWCWHPPSG